MDAALITPQMLILGGLVVLLLVALVARHFDQRRHTHGSRKRFGVDHSQEIFEMGKRTRAEAQRRERESNLLDVTSPHTGR
ncbi:MAG: hypothetical protein V4858_17695 [Pseudomonadota bacterium]